MLACWKFDEHILGEFCSEQQERGYYSRRIHSYPLSFSSFFFLLLLRFPAFWWEEGSCEIDCEIIFSPPPPSWENKASYASSSLLALYVLVHTFHNTKSCSWKKRKNRITLSRYSIFLLFRSYIRRNPTKKSLLHANAFCGGGKKRWNENWGDERVQIHGQGRI